MKNQRKSALFSWRVLWNAIWSLQNLWFCGSTCTPIAFSCHSLGVPLPFVPCLSKSSCDVVANRGRCRRWSPPWCCDSSKMCLLACVYARAHQRFCTFCFHNLHTLPLFCQRLSIETRELRQKTWEIFWKNSHVFQIISDVFFLCSDFLQHRFCFHEKPVVSCRSSFGSFSRLLPPLFLYFLALQHSTLKECLQSRRNHLYFSCLHDYLWRLWKQKVLFCRVRARTRTRETLILRLFTSQFPSEHSRVAFLTFKIEVQSTFPATVCS